MCTTSFAVLWLSVAAFAVVCTCLRNAPEVGISALFARNGWGWFLACEFTYTLTHTNTHTHISTDKHLQLLLRKDKLRCRTHTHMHMSEVLRMILQFMLVSEILRLICSAMHGMRCIQVNYTIFSIFSSLPLCPHNIPHNMLNSAFAIENREPDRRRGRISPSPHAMAVNQNGTHVWQKKNTNSSSTLPYHTTTTTTSVTREPVLVCGWVSCQRMPLVRSRMTF